MKKNRKKSEAELAKGQVWKTGNALRANHGPRQKANLVQDDEGAWTKSGADANERHR